MPDRPPRRRLDARFPPLPAKPQPFPVTPPLTRGLAELSGYWLDVQCATPACNGASSGLPLRLLAAEYGWGMQLGAVLPRLRCKACRCPPGIVLLTDRPDRLQPGHYGPGAGANVLRLL